MTKRMLAAWTAALLLLIASQAKAENAAICQTLADIGGNEPPAMIAKISLACFRDGDVKQAHLIFIYGQMLVSYYKGNLIKREDQNAINQDWFNELDLGSVDANQDYNNKMDEQSAANLPDVCKQFAEGTNLPSIEPDYVAKVLKRKVNKIKFNQELDISAYWTDEVLGNCGK